MNKQEKHFDSFYTSNFGLGDFKADYETKKVSWILHKSKNQRDSDTGIVFHSKKEALAFIQKNESSLYKHEKNVYLRKHYSDAFYRGLIFAHEEEVIPNPHYRHPFFCEACNDNGFLLSNDEKENPDLQRCDECKRFENDEQAKKHVLKFINKEAK